MIWYSEKIAEGRTVLVLYPIPTMNKRFQVFVSSTYTDLQDERQAVAQTLLKMQCISSGMEWFPADTEEQWAVIKRVIDDCDYYVLIIGGRYGSKTAEGLSYTEKEFDYALSKGLPVLVFCHQNPQDIPVKKSELDIDARAKLEAFRKRAMTGRTINFWINPDELAGKVAVAINTAITTKEGIGWVRGDQLTSTETLTDLNKMNKLVQGLQERNRELQERIAALQPSFGNIAEFNESFVLTGSGKLPSGKNSNWKLALTWSEIFGIIAPLIIVAQYESDLQPLVEGFILRELLKKPALETLRISYEVFQTVKIQLMALGLIRVIGSGDRPIWDLSTKGKETLFQIKAVKSKKTNK